MELTKFTAGQRYFAAELHVVGRGEADNVDAGKYSTREEAEADGRELASDYDPEWQKHHPDGVSAVVREYEVGDVEEDGSVGTAWTVD